MDKKGLNVCIDVGGTKILGLVIGEDNEILYEEKFRTAPGNGIDFVVKNIVKLIESMIENTKNIGVVKAIGIGIPGIIDVKTQEVIFSPNIGLKHFNLRNILTLRFDMPVFLGNDVNLGLLGEWKYGQECKFSNCLGVFVGTGIGGGIIIDNKLYTGSNSMAGEFGHICLDNDGPLCGCGQRGCLEAYAGKTGITNYIKAQIARGRKTELEECIEKEGAIRGSALKRALKSKDRVACEAVERMALFISRGVGSLINIFNPEAVILGGGIVDATKDLIIDMIRIKVIQYAIPEIFKNTQIISAKLGDRAVAFGAHALIEEQYGK